MRDDLLVELRACGLTAEGPFLVMALVALRRVLQTDAAHPLPSLRAALRELEVGLRPADERGGAAGVADDCADVAAWLERRRAYRTAYEFAELAAELGGGAGRALLAAGLAGRLDRPADAVRWAMRAWRLAGCARDGNGRAGALVSLGRMAAGAQRYAEAERLFALARRHARSRRLPEREGDALCGLALVRHAQERDEEAAALVLEALAAYGPRREAVIRLARTVLGMWVQAAEYRGAVAMGKLLLNLPLPSGEELAVCALSARAAAALGWELHYETACLRAILALGRVADGEPHGAALLDLARAHGALGFWPRVVLAAERAAADAEASGDAATAAAASAMLSAADMASIPRAVLAEHFPDEETEEFAEGEEPPAWEQAGRIVAAFADALEAA